MTIAQSVNDALAEFGRPMTLTRQIGGPTSVTVKGLLREFTADERRHGLQQGEAVVTISNSELAAAAWVGPPAADDKITADGRTWVVRGCETKFVGALAVAHELRVWGG